MPTESPYPSRTPMSTYEPGVPLKIERMVWAIYYPWYMESFYPRAWSSDIWTDRPLTPYESDDRDGIRQHLEWAKSAGIDGFLVEWCGIGRPDDNDIIDRNLSIVLDVAYQLDFNIAAYFDRACVNEMNSEKLEQQLEHLLTTHGQHPAYYWLNGKPVVVIYNSDELDPSSWQSVFARLEAKGLPAVYIGDSYDSRQLTVFNGLHKYTNFSLDNLNDHYAAVNEAVTAIQRSDPQREHFWAATVTPGFDNTPIYNGRDALNPGMSQSDILILDRSDEQTYRSVWELAIQSGAEWIIITSWNEWQENTHIEPSQMYGDEYLLITQEYIDLWKSTSP